MIYNQMGVEVQTLISSEAKAGNHTVSLDASRLASGMYYYRLKTAKFSATKKFIKL